jgi:hypothetical protein
MPAINQQGQFELDLYNTEQARNIYFERQKKLSGELGHFAAFSWVIIKDVSIEDVAADPDIELIIDSAGTLRELLIRHAGEPLVGQSYMQVVHELDGMTNF